MHGLDLAWHYWLAAGCTAVFTLGMLRDSKLAERGPSRDGD